jgi:chemotaxis protein CheX
MDEQKVRSFIETVTVESCVKLFQDYNVQVAENGSGSSAGEGILYCGIVGFTADNFRGSIVLSATSGPLEHSNPVKAASQRDWAAELTNQLAGRVKNRMLPHKVDISISTPVVLRGEHVFMEARSGLRPLVFDAPGGVITVWIDIELLDGFEMSFERDESQVAVEEGESMMF